MIGIDDGALRRNHRYGTIVCDLERRWHLMENASGTFLEAGSKSMKPIQAASAQRLWISSS